MTQLSLLVGLLSVRMAGGGFDVDEYLAAREEAADIGFKMVAEIVRFFQRHGRGNEEMEVNMPLVAGQSSAQQVEADKLFVMLF